MAKSNALFVYVTCPNKKIAKDMAEVAIKKRLAACANIIAGMSSLYFWKNRIERSKEVVLIFKTTQKMYLKLEKQICELHPYECPCVVALPIVFAEKKYLKWINKNVEEM